MRQRTLLVLLLALAGLPLRSSLSHALLDASAQLTRQSQPPVYGVYPTGGPVQGGTLVTLQVTKRGLNRLGHGVRGHGDNCAHDAHRRLASSLASSSAHASPCMQRAASQLQLLCSKPCDLAPR